MEQERNMEKEFEQGFDSEAEETATEKMDIVPAKQKRQPFLVWSAGGHDYKLKLTASAICKLEQKYRKNLLLLLTEEGLPPIATMLTVIQAAMIQYHHGMTYVAVQNAYDWYVDEGGDQNKLMSEVLMPLMGISGFFTQTQMEVLTEEMKDMETAL